MVPRDVLWVADSNHAVATSQKSINPEHCNTEPGPSALLPFTARLCETDTPGNFTLYLPHRSPPLHKKQCCCLCWDRKQGPPSSYTCPEPPLIIISPKQDLLPSTACYIYWPWDNSWFSLAERNRILIMWVLDCLFIIISPQLTLLQHFVLHTYGSVNPNCFYFDWTNSCTLHVHNIITTIVYSIIINLVLMMFTHLCVV